MFTLPQNAYIFVGICFLIAALILWSISRLEKRREEKEQKSKIWKV